MALVVQKYGGTSVGDADRIRAVADHVAPGQDETLQAKAFAVAGLPSIAP